MTPSPEKKAPFVGHLPFQSLDQSLFFGRDAEIKEAQSLIQSHSLLLLSGQAGVGKTSFLNAGLIPALEGDGIEVFQPVFVGKKSEDFSFAGISNIYISNVLSQWVKQDEEHPPELTQKTFAGFLDRRKPEAAEDNKSLRLIIFENLEILFTRHPEEHQKDREGFFFQVRDALEIDPLLRVIFVIRKAYADQLTPFVYLLPGKKKIHLILETLGEDTAITAIINPLKNRHITFKKGVAEALIKDLCLPNLTKDSVKIDKKHAMQRPLVEPTLLQLACERLWHDMPHDTTVITQNHRIAFANVDRALSLFYERSLQYVAVETGVKEKTLRIWFEQKLITSDKTRGRAYREETKRDGITDTALEALEDFHLIIGERQDNAYCHELSHDRLIRPVIEANHDWRARKNEEEQTHRDLKNQTTTSTKFGKKEDLILKDEALLVVQKNRAELAFEQVEKETRLAQRLSSRKRMISFIFVIATLLAIVVGLQWQSAENANITAKREDERAQEQALLAINREKEAALKVSGARRLETEREKADQERQQAEEQAALDADRAQEVLAAREKAIQDRQQAEEQAALAAARLQEALVAKEKAIQERQRAEEQAAVDAAHAQEALTLKEKTELEKKVTTATIEEKNSLVEESKKAPPLLSHALTAHAVKHLGSDPTLSALLVMQAFSISDFKEKSEVSEAEDVLYQAMHKLPLKLVLPAHDGRVNAVVFDRGGKRLHLISAGSDSTAKLWSSFSGDRLRTFTHNSPVTSIAYLKKGNQLATADIDGQIKVWQISSGKQLFSISHKEGAVKSIAFSPNQPYLASAGEKGTAILWDIQSKKQRYRLQGHQSAINQIVFSLNGKYLGTAGEDGTVRIWDVDSGKALLKLFWYEQAVKGLAFSPDNTLVASASKDGNVRLWDIRSFKKGEVQLILSGHTSAVLAVSFSPDGRRIATASEDGTVRLWNTISGKELAVLAGHQGAVTSLAFSPDGLRLATAGKDKTIRLYSLEIQDMLALVRNTVKRSLTPEECNQYLRTETCPPGT